MRILALVLACTGIVLAGPAARSEGELEPGAEIGSAPAEASAATTAQPGTIARAAFATAIVDREPQDAIETLANDHHQIFYFTELRGFEGQTITHRWEYDGKPVAEVFFEVRGPRWRVYSSKNLPEDALGQWSVAVVDDRNEVLRTDSFVYQQAAGSVGEPAPPGHEEPSAAAQPAETPEATPPAAPADMPAPAEETEQPETPAPGAMQY